MLHERFGQESLYPVRLTDSARRSSMFLNVSRLRTIASPRQKTPTVANTCTFLHFIHVLPETREENASRPTDQQGHPFNSLFPAESQS